VGPKILEMRRDIFETVTIVSDAYNGACGDIDIERDK